MVVEVDLDSIYRGDINLWVEDELTREYLEALWAGTGVKFLVAGGSDCVRGVVKDAMRTGQTNVFGVVDRDYGASNIKQWKFDSWQECCYCLPRHEIENYLLEPEAITSSRFNNIKRTADDIRAEMNRQAERLVWSAACNLLVAHYRRKFRQSFLKESTVEAVTDAGSAERHVVGSEWMRYLPRRTKAVTVLRVRKRLNAYHGVIRAQARGDELQRYFPGKEIFHRICSFVCDAARAPGTRLKMPEVYSDIAKEVAAWQSANDRVPTDLTALRDSLRRRVGLTG